MGATNDFDPELALIRAFTRGQHDPMDGRAVEQARFALWSALQARDTDLALRWLATLRVAVRAVCAISREAESEARPVMEAIDRIEARIEARIDEEAEARS